MDRPPLDLPALHAALDERWAQVEVVAETTSTNADLLARGTSAADRTLLAAEFQTAGRGRHDRVWTSPPRAGLIVSFLFRPQAPLLQWGWLPLLAGVAVVEAAREAAGASLSLKWPNDVRVGEAKLAGILSQSVDGAVVIGIGLNVSTAADELPPEVAATSLALAGAATDRTALLAALATRLDTRVAQWDDCGGDAGACGLAASYREVCDTLGREVEVAITDDTVLTGVAHDLDEAGHLVVRAGDRHHVVTAGDVRHLRPAPGTR